MKTVLLSCCAAAALMGSPAALAQANSGNYSGTAATGSSGTQNWQGSVGTENAFFHAQAIIGTEAEDPQGKNLGKVHDVVFNPATSRIFAAIDVGNNRYALVPWQAVTVSVKGNGNNNNNGGGWWGGGNKNSERLVINTTQDALRAGPSISGNQMTLLSNPSFLQSVYTYYRIQEPQTADAYRRTGLGTAGGSSTGSNAGSGSNRPVR